MLVTSITDISCSNLTEEITKEIIKSLLQSSINEFYSSTHDKNSLIKILHKNEDTNQICSELCIITKDNFDEIRTILTELYDYNIQDDFNKNKFNEIIKILKGK
jgi:hypothetical protein